MRNKIIVICLAGIGFAGSLVSAASTSEATNARQPGVVAVSTLPATARINQTVVLETGGGYGHRHHYYHRHHHYRRHHYYRHYGHRHHHYYSRHHYR